MKENKKSLWQNTAKKFIQHRMEQEAKAWPPICWGAFYQPSRPEKALAPLESKKEH